MKRLLIIAAAAAALSGCSTLTGGNVDAAAVLKAANEHIETCDRDYQGGLGVGANFTFKITCKAAAPAATQTP
jgi:hypothetical protein